MHPRTPLAAGLDTAIVVAFVAIGRREHDQGSAITGLLSTAAPFLIALSLAWALWRVWARPVDIVTGVQVWATTISAGMLLRRVVFDDGTALAFAIVATIFLALLVGWRIGLTTVERRRAPVR